MSWVEFIINILAGTSTSSSTYLASIFYKSWRMKKKKEGSKMGGRSVDDMIDE